MSDQQINALLQERTQAWEQAKDILDRCRDEKRARTAEENEMFDRANADIDRLGSEVAEMRRLDEVEKENATYREAFADILPSETRSDTTTSGTMFSRWLRGEGTPVLDVDITRAQKFAQQVRAGADPKELRAIYTDGGASGGSMQVPVGFERELYQYMEEQNSVLRIANVIVTDTGGPFTLPRLTSHGVGTQVSGQGTALAGTDPVFGTVRLDDYRYGQLVKLSKSSITDFGWDVEGFVGQNIGRALGRVTAGAYVTGGGSSAPNGVVTAAGSIVTGGTLITATYEKLIDLQHSIATPYWNGNGDAAFLMNSSTAGSLRKLRSGAGGTEGDFLWTPATYVAGVTPMGLPDRLLNSPVYIDSNVADQGSAAKAVVFGDWSAFVVRLVGGVQIERSDQRYFDTEEIGYRGVVRTDSDLMDSAAIKTLHQRT